MHSLFKIWACAEDENKVLIAWYAIAIYGISSDFYYLLPSACNHDIFISNEVEKSVCILTWQYFYLLNERNIYSQSQPEQSIRQRGQCLAELSDFTSCLVGSEQIGVINCKNRGKIKSS